MAPLIEVNDDYLNELDSKRYIRRSDLEKSLGMIPTDKEVTFENTIKEGNEINVDGKKCKVTLVKHQAKESSDGGHYRVLFQPLDGSLEIQKYVSRRDAIDWYILYQNGRK